MLQVAWVSEAIFGDVEADVAILGDGLAERRRDGGGAGTGRGGVGRGVGALKLCGEVVRGGSVGGRARSGL